MTCAAISWRSANTECEKKHMPKIKWATAPGRRRGAAAAITVTPGRRRGAPNCGEMPLQQSRYVWRQHQGGGEVPSPGLENTREEERCFRMSAPIGALLGGSNPREEERGYCLYEKSREEERTISCLVNQRDTLVRLFVAMMQGGGEHHRLSQKT